MKQKEVKQNYSVDYKRNKNDRFECSRMQSPEQSLSKDMSESSHDKERCVPDHFPHGSSNGCPGALATDTYHSFMYKHKVF